MPPANTGLTYPAAPLRQDEVEALLRAAGSTVPGLRAQALVAVCWRAGARVSEALHLEVGDVDTASGDLHLRVTKGRKQEASPGRSRPNRPRDSAPLARDARPPHRHPTLGLRVLHQLRQAPHDVGHPALDGAPRTAGLPRAPRACARAPAQLCGPGRPRWPRAPDRPGGARACEPRDDRHLPAPRRTSGGSRSDAHPHLGSVRDSAARHSACQ